MSDEGIKQMVQIHIDHQVYSSPNPTTGAALYALGHVAADAALFKDAHGQGDDEAIENAEEEVHLHQGDHFHTGPHKTFTIIVNGQQKTVSTTRVSFSQLVTIAFPTPPGGQNILYTITYDNGPRSNPQGSVLEGRSVKVQNGMIFNVTATDKS